ncbi:MAG: TlpA disulfide reductase family protein [Methylococcus sp.]
MKPRSLALLILGLLTPITAVMALESSGQPAPQCALTHFKDGQPIDWSSFKGKVVYLDFWASWCGPCAKSIPFMDELSRTMKSKGLEVVAVNLDESRAEAEAFLVKHPVQFTIAADTGECPKKYDLETMPTSFLIDREGNISKIHRGFNATDQPEITQALEHLLKGTGDHKAPNHHGS